MKIDYNMLVQNHVHYNYVVQKYQFISGGAMVKNLILNVKVRNSSPHTCNLGYFGYLNNLIR